MAINVTISTKTTMTRPVVRVNHDTGSLASLKNTVWYLRYKPGINCSQNTNKTHQ